MTKKEYNRLVKQYYRDPYKLSSNQLVALIQEEVRRKQKGKANDK